MNQPLFRENAKKFYQSAYRVQKSQSMISNNKPTDLALSESPQLQRSESAPATIGKNVTLSQLQRHEKGDHTFRNVLLFLIVAGIFVFAVDLYKQIHQERVELQIKRKKCHNQFIENECENAVDQMKAKCHSLQMCFKHDVEMGLRTTQIAAKLVGRLVSTFLNETGWLGAALVVALLIVVLIFIYKDSRSAFIHEMTLKKE